MSALLVRSRLPLNVSCLARLGPSDGICGTGSCEDKWAVKMDVRDLVRHLDTTRRGWSSTFCARFRLVTSRLNLILCPPAGLPWPRSVGWDHA